MRIPFVTAALRRPAAGPARANASLRAAEAPNRQEKASRVGPLLAPAYGDGLKLWFDPDQVDALSGDREALWVRVAAADFLTVNEKRAAVGYGAIDGGDALGGVAALSAKYSPDQPRVPSGSADGGQWTADGGGAGAGDSGSAGGRNGGEQLAQADRGGLPVGLAEEERRGGHAIADHVGKDPTQLLARAGQKFWTIDGEQVTRRDGSFPNLVAANKLVNSTISRNQDVVDQVVAGTRDDAFITATFSTQTGIEAYRSTKYSQPYLRDTYGVGVYIVHDDASPNGYTVVTAYPRND